VPDLPPRAFIDTNIWISAFINPAGAPAKVFEALYQDRFVPVVSQALLVEIESVARRPRIRQRIQLSDEALENARHDLSYRAIHVIPTGELRLCRDQRDDILLETALRGEAQYAVSRDDDIKRDLDLMAHLRANGVEVVSVAQFLELLNDA
jgi:putative PIN family toxin of toxin-antitoxin system